MPVPAVLPGRTSSAVCSRISRVSSGRSRTPASLAAEMTSAAAPEAWPVACEPVEPTIENDDLPPNCVVLPLRKNVRGCSEVETGSLKAEVISLFSPRPSVSDTVPWMSSAWP